MEYLHISSMMVSYQKALQHFVLDRCYMLWPGRMRSDLELLDSDIVSGEDV
jgi:hypothetical protein